MSTSFTTGAQTVQPLVVDGWDSTRSAQNIVQNVFGGGVDAVLYPAAPRSGTLVAIFLDLVTAVTFETMLAGTDVITFADSDSSVLGMSFVAVDDIRIARGDDVVARPDGVETFAWAVTFSFQQVTS